ncbi:cupin domain-containing protein [Nocardia stercoris]|uniref:Cupin n=1 Tax=Nocardia stercoris TaxID=2483361 RepID=A0A3M2LBT6_9NOCA|nr:cupin [Nocardia stercoris]RMI34033.1 cupin [Nocardia stercoris]
MTMPMIRADERRRTETPNAVMTTLASPTQGGGELAVWQVDMAPGAAGPDHAFDTELVWTAVGGAARIELGADELTVAAGDTVVMAADVRRRIFADAERGFAAIVCARGGALAYTLDANGRAGADAAPACAQRIGDRLLPAWVA